MAELPPTVSELAPTRPGHNSIDQLLQDWVDLGLATRLATFSNLDRDTAEELFLSLDTNHRAEIITSLSPIKRRSWLRMLPLDDTADLIQALDPDQKVACLDLLDTESKREVTALLAYAEDDAGGLMTPHLVRLKPHMNIDVAVRYLRAYSKHHEETVYYTYVVDEQDRLLGIVPFRDLLFAQPDKQVSDIMNTDFVSVLDTMDQELVAKVFVDNQLSAIPVVDPDGKLKGVVTYDDIAQAIQEEDTEDFQKIGGMEALDQSYWETSFWDMLKKRAGWLVVLFIGGMLTTTAMTYYSDAITQAVVLALFIPLIISSGGNSGSQASTLIIRAIALGEVKLKHWWKVLYRELGTGLALGLVLGLIGMARIGFWPNTALVHGPHYWKIAMTVGISLVGIVLWGAITGAMLPFALKRLKLDPASASAPLVATLVDVTGIILYFKVATWMLSNQLFVN